MLNIVHACMANRGCCGTLCWTSSICYMGCCYLHDRCATGVPQQGHDQVGGLWLCGQQASWRVPCKQPADGQAAAQGHWPGWQESSPNGKSTHFVHRYALSSWECMQSLPNTCKYFDLASLAHAPAGQCCTSAIHTVHPGDWPNMAVTAGR